MSTATRDHNPLYVKIAYITIILVAFFYVLEVGQKVIVPILFATIFSILLNSMVNFLERKGMNRVLAIFITVIVGIILVVGVVYFVATQISSFMDTLPEFKERFKMVLKQVLAWVSSTLYIKSGQLNAWVEQAKDGGTGTQTMITYTVNGVGRLIVISFLLPVYIFMILYYKPILLEFIARLFPKEKHDTVTDVLTETQGLIQSYLRGLLIQASIIFVLASTALSLLGIKYALLLGVLSALFNFIPYIGGLSSMVLPAVIALTTKPPQYALYVLACYICIQFIDNNIVVPRIVASRVKINALISIIAVLIGGALWGVAGMFLSIPCTAILKVIFDRVEPLKPFGFLLGDTMPPIGKSIFNRRYPKKKQA